MMNRGKAILELALHIIAARLTIQQHEEQRQIEDAARQKRNHEREWEAKRLKVQKRRRNLRARVMERLREREEEG